MQMRWFNRCATIFPPCVLATLLLVLLFGAESVAGTWTRRQANERNSGQNANNVSPDITYQARPQLSFSIQFAETTTGPLYEMTLPNTFVYAGDGGSLFVAQVLPNNTMAVKQRIPLFSGSFCLTTGTTWVFAVGEAAKDVTRMHLIQLDGGAATFSWNKTYTNLPTGSYCMSPAYAASTLTVLLGNTIINLDLAGNERWKRTFSGVVGDFALLEATSLIYFAQASPPLVRAIHVNTGADWFTASLSPETICYTGPVAVPLAVFIACGRSLFFLDPNTGGNLVQPVLVSQKNVESPLVVAADSRVIVATLTTDGNCRFQAYDVVNRTLVWSSVSTTMKKFSLPIAANSGDLVYLTASTPPNFAMIDFQTGKIKMVESTARKGTSYSPVAFSVTNNGFIMLTLANGSAKTGIVCAYMHRLPDLFLVPGWTTLRYDAISTVRLNGIYPGIPLTSVKCQFNSLLTTDVIQDTNAFPGCDIPTLAQVGSADLTVQILVGDEGINDISLFPSLPVGTFRFRDSPSATPMEVVQINTIYGRSVYGVRMRGSFNGHPVCVLFSNPMPRLIIVPGEELICLFYPSGTLIIASTITFQLYSGDASYANVVAAIGTPPPFENKFDGAYAPWTTSRGRWFGSRGSFLNEWWLYRPDLTGGSTEFRFQLFETLVTPFAIANDHSMLAVIGDGTVIRLNPSGKLMWRTVQLPNMAGTLSSATVTLMITADSRVVVVYPTTIAIIDFTAGVITLSNPLPSGPFGAALTRNGTAAISVNGVAQVMTPGFMFSSSIGIRNQAAYLAVHPVKDALLLANTSGSLALVMLKDATTLWTTIALPCLRSSDNDLIFSSKGETAYVSCPGSVYAFNMDDGKMRWPAPISGEIRSISILSNDYLMIWSDMTFTAYRERAFGVAPYAMWTRNDLPFGYFSVFPTGRTVLITTLRVYELDPFTGTILAITDLISPIREDLSTISPDGFLIYVGVDMWIGSRRIETPQNSTAIQIAVDLAAKVPMAIDFSTPEGQYQYGLTVNPEPSSEYNSPEELAQWLPYVIAFPLAGYDAALKSVAPAIAVRVSATGCWGPTCVIDPSLSGETFLDGISLSGNVVSSSTSAVVLPALNITMRRGNIYQLEIDLLNKVAFPLRYNISLAKCSTTGIGLIPTQDGFSCRCPHDFYLYRDPLKTMPECYPFPSLLRFSRTPSAIHDASGTLVVQPELEMAAISVIGRNITWDAQSVNPGVVSVMASMLTNNGLISGSSIVPMIGTAATFSNLGLSAPRGTVQRMLFIAAIPGLAQDVVPPSVEVSIRILACDEVQPNTVSLTNGSASCICAPQYFLAGPGNCQRCPVGTTKPNAGNDAQCTCIQDYYRPPGSTGTDCLHCPVGSRSSAALGADSCICLANFTLDAVSGSCVPCPAGTQKTIEGAGSCTCLSGFWRPDSDLSGPCVACPEGSFKNFTGSGRCTCLDGYYRRSENENCVTCPAGTEKHVLGDGPCVCRSGFVPASDISDGSCFQCPSNAVVSEDRQTCVCKAGSYPDPNFLGKLCLACPFGSSKNWTGNADCLCDVGWTRESSAETCKPCPENTYRDVNHTSCVPCPTSSSTRKLSGAFAVAGCLCDSGTYFDTNPGSSAGTQGIGGGSSSSSSNIFPTGAACTSCPRGAECAGGMEQPRALPGYWTVPSSDSALGVEFVECGGGTESPCRGNNTCKAGFEGLLCGACISGYGRFGAFSCLRCTKARDWILFSLFIGFFLLQLVFLIRSALKRNALVTSVALRSILEYMQTLFFVGSFNFRFPISLQRSVLLPSSVSTGGTDFVPLDCTIGWEDDGKLMFFSGLGLALSIVFLGSLVVLAVLLRGSGGGAKPGSGNGSGSASPPKPIVRRLGFFLRGVLVLILTLYPIITSASLRAYGCKEIAGYRYLSSDVRVDCDSPASRRLRVLAGLALGIFSVFTIVVVFVIRAWAVRQTPDADMESDEVAPLVSPFVVHALEITDFLALPYRRGREIFAAVVLGRKMMLVVIAILVVNHPAQACAFAVIVLVSSLLLNALFKPHRSRWQLPGLGSQQQTVRELQSKQVEALAQKSWVMRAHILYARLGGLAMVENFGLCVNLVTLGAGPSFRDTSDDTTVDYGYKRQERGLVAIVLIANGLMAVLILLTLFLHVSSRLASMADSSSSRKKRPIAEDFFDEPAQSAAASPATVQPAEIEMQVAPGSGGGNVDE